MRRLSSVLVCLTLLTPMLASTVSAQEATGSGSAQTASGSLFITESAELKKERATRTKDFHQKLLQSAKADEQFRSQQSAYLVKRAENRRACRESLRKANRDNKFPITLSCFRVELSLEKVYREKEAAWLAVMVGVPNAPRANVVSRLDLLQQAIDTVLLAVDSKVYATTDDLIEARRNILTKYRTPYTDSLVIARLQSQLTWAQQMIVSIDAVRSERKNMDTETAALWDGARLCFTDAESALHALLEDEATPTVTDVRTSMNSLALCIKKLSPLVGIKTASGSTVTP